MNGRPLSRLNLSSAGLLVRSAALLVPAGRRADWTAEWLAELWHVGHVSDAESPLSATPVAFAAGAVNDALQLRAHRLRTHGTRLRSILHPGSPARCLLLLAAGTLAALSLCLGLPGSRRVLLPAPYQHADSLVLLNSSGNPDPTKPTIHVADYREWTHNTAPLFSDLAFYRVADKTVHLADGPQPRLTVAQASPNLLYLLGLAPLASDNRPALYLTRSAWQRRYAADPHLVGRVSDIDGTPVPIAGILPADAWQLPGSVDAVLLESPAMLARFAPTTSIFAIARIRGAVFPPPRDGTRFMVETRFGVVYHYDCISLPHWLWLPLDNLFLVLLFACLAAPATLPLSLSEAPVRRGHLPHATFLRRAAFLAAKLALVPTLVLLASTALAWGPSSDPNTAVFTQFITGVPTLLFAFRWIFHDQRRRCPECLRLLSNPARVGQASCNFLAWNGTELLCVRGHGLLHIPELPTSWFSTQRWLALDASWLCLFSEPSNPSPEPV